MGALHPDNPRHHPAMFARLRARRAFFRPLPLMPVLALCLGACTSIDEAALTVFASNAPASGLFAGRVMQGNANFIRAREGSLHLQSTEGPALSCFGALRLTATLGGVASLSCSDGQSVAIPFQLLSPLRGSGRVQVGEAMFALTYGLPAETASAYLGLPVERLLPAP
jgi:hypothetical protein